MKIVKTLIISLMFVGLYFPAIVQAQTGVEHDGCTYALTLSVTSPDTVSTLPVNVKAVVSLIRTSTSSLKICYHEKISFYLTTPDNPEIEKTLELDHEGSISS
jgi:hypothetical protein